jgi:hypothetical protein
VTLRHSQRVAATRKHLDPADGPANNGALRLKVSLVERPDPDGRRWTAAIELLLQAGHGETEIRFDT